MGDPPYTPGDHCDVCWGEGKIWDGWATPKSILAIITGVVRQGGPFCGAFPDDCDNIIAVLTQDPGSPCIWKGEMASSFVPAIYFVAYSLTPTSSTLQCNISGALTVFGHTIMSTCIKSFTNQNVPPACYQGGTGGVT